jgi:hypothetical protein
MLYRRKSHPWPFSALSIAGNAKGCLNRRGVASGDASIGSVNPIAHDEHP